GASLGPAVIGSLCWKRTTRWGVFAGMLAGTVLTIGWRLGVNRFIDLYELIPAFFGSVFAIVIVSMLTARRGPARPDSVPR
ncbi:MAG: sodium/proline symporter, partial [bacterium]